MNIIITHPRSGSNLSGYLYKAQPFTAVYKDGPAYLPIKVIRRINTGESVWFHYPYSQPLADFLATVDANKYVLLRDPRDIIVSIAHRVQALPQTLVNYRYGDKRIGDFPFERRIDILIDMMYGQFCDFDRWRKDGGLAPIYYSDLVQHPDAGKYKEHLARGVVGAYKDEMTEEQQARATKVYRYLIRYWAK